MKPERLGLDVEVEIVTEALPGLRAADGRCGLAPNRKCRTAWAMAHLFQARPEALSTLSEQQQPSSTPNGRIIQ